MSSVLKKPVASPRKRASKARASSKSTKMLQVLKLFRMLVKSIRGHYQVVENRSGVSGAQLWALAHVAGNPGCKVGELASALAIHQSTASNLVGRLESLGLLARHRLRDDQRTVELTLTSKGRSALAIHQSTASNLVGRLESLGLLARHRLRHDQRSVELKLTSKGRSALARAPRPLIGVLQQALLDLPEASLDALHQHLGVLIGTMKIKDTRSRATPLSDM